MTPPRTSRPSLPAAGSLEPQIVAGMAWATSSVSSSRRRVAITVEGREDDLAAFADRLEQLARLCR